MNNIGCELQSGYAIGPCYAGMGGIKELYIVNSDYFNLVGSSFDSEDKITFLNMIGGHTWYRFELISETAEYLEKQVDDSKTGSIFFEQNLTVVFHNNTSALRKQLLQLINTNGVACIFKDNHDLYWLAGATRNMRVTSEIKWEKSFAGLNGEIRMLKATEPFPAYEVVGSAIMYSDIVITGGGRVYPPVPVGPLPD